MREMRLSGSMSGNRNQSHAKPDWGAPCESIAFECHREPTATAPVLDSTHHHGELWFWLLARPTPECALLVANHVETLSIKWNAQVSIRLTKSPFTLQIARQTLLLLAMKKLAGIAENVPEAR
jgi:hypothetical protein